MDHDRYLDCVRQALLTALCVCDGSCRHVDGWSKPEVEVQDSPELILPSVTIRRTDHEQCLIEPSYNSVRISFKVRAAATSKECQLRERHTYFTSQLFTVLCVPAKPPWQIAPYDSCRPARRMHLVSCCSSGC